MIPRYNSLKTVMVFITAFLLAAPIGCSSFSCVKNAASSVSSKAAASRTTSLSMGLFGGTEKEETKMASKNVMDIPVLSIKAKPLRFFLQIYIVGEQNTQDSQMWLPRESEDGGSLQIYFHDGSGMCQIDLLPDENTIRVERHGQAPSLAYQLQESVMLHGVLDELYQMAFEGEEDVKESERLLLLGEDVIDECRKTLPARSA